MIDELTEIGLKIETVISDLGSNFRTRKSLVYVQGKRSILPVRLTTYQAIRNNLINYNFHFNGKIASWDDIKYIFEHDQQQTFRCCPKLTKNIYNH